MDIKTAQEFLEATATLNPFLILAIAFALTAVAISMIVVHQLSKWNIKINLLLLRFLIPKYVFQCKEITRKETGKTGMLFYGWIISINLALVTLIVALIF